MNEDETISTPIEETVEEAGEETPQVVVPTPSEETPTENLQDVSSDVAWTQVEVVAPVEVTLPSVEPEAVIRTEAAKKDNPVVPMAIEPEVITPDWKVRENNSPY